MIAATDPSVGGRAGLLPIWDNATTHLRSAIGKRAKTLDDALHVAAASVVLLILPFFFAFGHLPEKKTDPPPVPVKIVPG